MDVKRRQKYMRAPKDRDKSEYIDMSLDLSSLTIIAEYVASLNANIKRNGLLNIKKLFSMLNIDNYRRDETRLELFKFINKAIEARLDLGLNKRELIIKHACGGISGTQSNIIKGLSEEFSNKSVDWVNRTISASLKNSFIFKAKSEFKDLIAEFEATPYAELETTDISDKWIKACTEMVRAFRKATIESNHETMFTLKKGEFENVVTDIHKDLCSPSAMLYSGMQGMNDMLGGGFYNSKVYMLFGAPAGGKSLTLLQLACQIKKYNKSFKPKDPSKTPCIVILTQENTVKESVERLFNINVTPEDIRNYTTEEVINLLQTKGELMLSTDSPIDILIKFKPSGSIDTTYMYTLVENLEDEGYECVAFMHDYIKHILPANPKKDLRLDLGQILNEYKAFASIKDIPVIGLSQINRDGIKTIDSGADNNQADLTRLLGRANVGESMLIIENTDFAALLNMEYDRNGNQYLVLKRIKIRYGKSKIEYICQPFIKGTIKLHEDFYSAVPVHKKTLRENLNMPSVNIGQTITESNGTMLYTARKRRNIEDVLAERNKKAEEEKVLEQSNSPKLHSNAFDMNKFSKLTGDNKDDLYISDDEQPTDGKRLAFTIEREMATV